MVEIRLLPLMFLAALSLPTSTPLFAQNQGAPTNAPVPASSEIPQKTTSVPAAPLPTWKEIEAVPDYAKATPAQRKHVFDKWLQLKAESGDPVAQIVLQWQQKAEAGDQNAQCQLGVSYFLGQFCPGYDVLKDQAEGVKWLQKSAGQGNAEAQGCLG